MYTINEVSVLKTITKITRQKNNPERYNIFLNEKYAFAVDEGTLIKFGLTKDKVLDDFEIDEINFEDEIAKAFNKGLQFLAFQMRSEHEVKSKLLRAGHGEAVVMEAIRKLEKLGFLNDESYSKALLETKKRTMKKGPRAIRQDMQKKGIDKKLQDATLAQFGEDEQLQLALSLAEKEVRAGSRKTPAQVKQKIQDMLLRKGYSFTIVSEVFEKIQLEREDNEWQQLIELQGDKLWTKYSSKLSGFELHLKMKQALYQKGFPSDVIETYIEEKRKQHE